MKKLIFAAIIAIAGWFTSQAQMLPAPEKYNQFLEQMAKMDQRRAEFLMNATMETLAKDPKAYRQMMDLAERRFSDPADPIHNEGLYLAVLKHATEKFVLSGGEIEKQRLLLQGAKKNMIGSVAADFDYIVPGDKATHRLSELKADNILVYFNNPDCEACELVKQRLAENETINKLINDKKLIVLSIYPYNDQKLWSKTKYPSMMINGFNKSGTIEYQELYDLPTLPCFYLLDSNYKVLVKNEGSLNKVEAKLNELQEAKIAGPEPAPATAQPTPKPTIVTTAAAADDPNTIRSEEIMGYVLENKGGEIYNSLSDKIKAKIEPNQFDDILPQLEEKAGKYQSHEAWNIQQVNSTKAYSSVMKFEKAELGMLIVYDEDGKIMGVQIVPAQAIRKQ